MPKTISFEYLNHRGERSTRTIDVDSIEYQANVGFGYQAGWFISGFCHDRKARRSFALTRIILPEDTKNLYTLLSLKG